MSLYDLTWFLLRLFLSLNMRSSMKQQLIFTVCYTLGPVLSALPHVILTINLQDTTSTPFYRWGTWSSERVSDCSTLPCMWQSLNSPGARAQLPGNSCSSHKQVSWAPCCNCQPTSPPPWGRRWSARRTRPRWSTRLGGPQPAGGSSGLAGNSAAAGSRSLLWCSTCVLEHKTSDGFSTGRTCFNYHYR